LSVGISVIGIDFCTLYNFPPGIILICLNIVVIKFLGDVPEIMKLGVSCFFAMIRPAEGTLVEKWLEAKVLTMWILYAYFV